MRDVYCSTRHAAERWRQRIDRCTTFVGAGLAMRSAAAQGVKVPNRAGAQQWDRMPEGSGKTRRTRQARRNGMSYIYHPTAVLLVRGGDIVTILPVGPDDYATVLAWLLVDAWPAEES